MLRLEIDRARWDAHLAKVNADAPGLVPVAKGNGYGLGMDRCVDEALKLGADTLAVGTFAEARGPAGAGRGVLQGRRAHPAPAR